MQVKKYCGTATAMREKVALKYEVPESSSSQVAKYHELKAED